MQFSENLLTTLRQAKHVVVMTGAGTSAESGVHTFRGAQVGLWSQYDPMDLATENAFERDPQLVWKWYNWRKELSRRAKPNRGHYAIVELSKLVPRLTLVTQNVDGMHQRAGSENVIEFHGNLFSTICSKEKVKVDVEALNAEGDSAEPLKIPICPKCGAMIRPGVVWYGEPIPSDALRESESSLLTCDVFFSVGTSSLVWPAAGLAEMALEKGIPVVEVNPEKTPLSSKATFNLQGPSVFFLPDLVNRLKEGKSRKM